MSVTIEQHGSVRVITINRPEVRNALDGTTMVALAAALDDAVQDDGTSAVVLTGAGDRAFCAGVDLVSFSKRGTDEPSDDWSALVPFLSTTYPKPLVAAVNGAAVAAGFELLLGCDIIVAAEHAFFGIPEVKRGLIAAGGGTDLPRRVPLAIALEMGLTGDPLSAARAYEVGLVNRVVPAGEALAQALEIAAKIAENAPLSLLATKSLMYQALDVDRSTSLRLSSEATIPIWASADAAEGALAFAEKRAARWTGK
jgi:enoyl-CoA hydratase